MDKIEPKPNESRLLTDEELINITTPCQRNETCPLRISEEPSERTDDECRLCGERGIAQAQDAKTASIYEQKLQEMAKNHEAVIEAEKSLGKMRVEKAQREDRSLKNRGSS